MSDPTNPHIQQRTTPQWAPYQCENFWKPNEGQMPLFNTDPQKLEERTKEILSEGGWYYYLLQRLQGVVMGEDPLYMDEWRRISNGRPFIIKGIRSVTDAKKCVEYGIRWDYRE